MAAVPRMVHQPPLDDCFKQHCGKLFIVFLLLRNQEEGPSYATTPNVSAASSSLYIAPNNPSTMPPGWLPTNYPQYPTSKCGPANSDQQPDGYTGPQTAGASHLGAYNFFIQAPSPAGYSLWVFNPSCIPTEPSSCNGYQLPDQFFENLSCSSYYAAYPPVQPSATGNFDDPRLYFHVTYTLYTVPVLYDRTGDQVKCAVPGANPPQISCQPQIPYDGMSADLAKHGCGMDYVYQLPTTSGGTGSCVLGSPWPVNQNNWEKIADDLFPTPGNQPGLFRLAVEAMAHNSWSDPSCSWGMHSYGIKLCPDKYADPKSVDGCWGSPPVVPAGTSVRPWTNMDIMLLFNNAKPSGYLGGQWWLNVFNDQGKDFNEIAVSFSLNGGSPIHIVL